MLPDEQRLLARLTEATSDSLWMFTADWQELVFVNSAYEDIFGHPVASLEEDPTSFVDAIHPDDRGTVTEAMERLSGGEPVDLEFRVDPATGYRTWAWVQGEPVYGDAGELEYLAGYARDITTRKRYERELERQRTELERSNESLREFAYIASHDLQEPLRMVSSYVDLLETEYGDRLDEEAEKYMEYAVDGARRMKRMINSLLEYSRVHTDADEFEETDVNAVLDDVRQDLELLIDDYDAELSVGELPVVEADRDQIGQVFQNLLKNAIRHAGENGTPEVEVRGSERDDAYVFAVSDDGPGVPAEQQDEIFDIFRKGPSASDAESTGIGLAVVQRIVQRHGGEIRVESPPDAGATFEFIVPKDPSVPDPEGHP